MPSIESRHLRLICAEKPNITCSGTPCTFRAFVCFFSVNHLATDALGFARGGQLRSYFELVILGVLNLNSEKNSVIIAELNHEALPCCSDNCLTKPPAPIP